MSMPDPTPQDAPDATADRETLLAWYRDVVQVYAATHAYEDFVVRCYWCLEDDQQVKARNASRHDGNKYCTDRCADAAEAYRVKVLESTRQPQPKAEETEKPAASVTAAEPPPNEEW